MEAKPTKAELPEGKRRWFQFSLRTLMIVVTLLAVACATPGITGPPLIRTYREAMQQHYMPNPAWFLATFVEIYAVRLWFVLSRRAAGRRAQR